MSDPIIPESEPTTESTESFGDIFAQYQQSHSLKSKDGEGREGTVIAVSSESVLMDIGRKVEGILPLAAVQSAGEAVRPGDKLLVTITGRDPESGYYTLSRGKVSRPTDWESLERAFVDKATIVGTVTGVVKGGLTVDVGVRAFLPGSRSGVRDSTELTKLVGQEVRCRITKLDVADEDVVVDCRAVAEQEERATKERRYSELKEGETVRGTVRSLTDYGAFVDIGGVDALLHVSDIAWRRISKPADVLSLEQEIEAMVLKVDPDKGRISLGMKQLLPHPWDSAAEKYKTGERVRGCVTRLADFGAFVEVEPGIEGLIHISEMAWSRRVRHPSDVVKTGESVEAVILAVNTADRRISLGLKQALGDPWAEVTQRFAVGSVIEGPVTNFTKFGAFVELSEGVEGMVHISEISGEKRIAHPQEVLKIGQVVKAQVLEVDLQKRQIRLSVKQLVPSSLDEYIAERKEGDVVTGRMTEVSGGTARVELGEGVQGTCRMPVERPAGEEAKPEAKVDISLLTSMLSSRWMGGTTSEGSQPEAVVAGQVRSFRIVKLDPTAKKIELELV
jgi:small subunit ribosomal protein S1